MTRQFKTAAVGVAVLLAVAAMGDQGTLEILTHTAEVEELALTGAASQTVFVRECDECPVLALSIEAETRYFDGKRPIYKEQAVAIERGATVYFDKQSRVVTRIVFWR